MKAAALIFVGGGLGSVARFMLGKWVSGLHELSFPIGTLVVNVIACFVLGVIIGLADQKQLLSPDMRVFWAIGFCGGFSTFSTFSAETLLLFQQQNVVSGLGYVAASVALCLGATMLGMVAAR